MPELEQIVFVLASLVKTGAVLGVALTMVAYTVLAERRFSAFIQDRVGPNRVGIPFTNIGLSGFGQPIADAVKLLLKEDFTPKHVNKFYFYLAPVLTVMPPLIVLAVIPFGSFIDLQPIAYAVYSIMGWTAENLAMWRFDAVVANIDVSLLFIFAIVSISVYGIVFAGWSSNSKYSFLGGIRASAQMISYELTLGLAVVPVFLLIGSLSLTEIAHYQATNHWIIFPEFSLQGLLLWGPLFISFILFTVSAFAETNRLPFDIPESEQELIGGYHTEYSSMKFALFFMGEYAAMVAASGVLVTVFLGGWSLPLPWFNGQAVPEDCFILAGAAMPWWFWVVHIGVFLAKVAAVLFVFIWVRWTLPRFRYDQLMNLGWKAMIPIGFANIFFAALVLLLMQ